MVRSEAVHNPAGIPTTHQLFVSDTVAASTDDNFGQVDATGRLEVVVVLGDAREGRLVVAPGGIDRKVEGRNRDRQILHARLDLESANDRQRTFLELTRVGRRVDEVSAVRLEIERCPFGVGTADELDRLDARSEAIAALGLL